MFNNMQTFSVYISGDVQHLFFICVCRMGRNLQSDCLVHTWVVLWDILRSILQVSAWFLTYMTENSDV